MKMMKSTLAFVLVSVLSCASAQTQSDLLKVKSLFVRSFESNNTNGISAWMSSLESTGVWPDIDYSNTYNEPPITHLNRISTMAAAYATKTNKLHNDSAVLASASKALNYWFAKDYVNGNWWWNFIGFPDVMGPICLLLEHELTTSQLEGCHRQLARGATTGWTGANLIWTAEVQIFDGLLFENVSWVAKNYKLIYEEVVIIPKGGDGVKIDGSFFQHSLQEYSGGYGNDYTRDVLRVSKFATGTAFAMPAANLEVLALHVLDGQQWMMQLPSRRWDSSCKGREITRPGNQIEPPFDVADVGGPRAKEWELYYQRMTSASAPKRIGNRNYWVSDYMIHSRANYMASVKMFSTRTANSECVNSEGKQSVYLSSGVNYLMLNGSEYAGIYPLWDWQLIPGSTVERDSTPLECSQVRTVGRTKFVGVVSDGLYGSSAYDLAGPWASKVVAKKSWHFFDDEYVALGSGISVASGNEVTTTLDQKWLRGVVASSSQKEVPQEKATLLGISWLHHDSVGYLFPNNETIQIDTTKKSGNWLSINVYNTPATGDTFLAYIAHDKKKVASSTGDSYAYIVVPGVSQSEFTSQAEKVASSIKIVANNDKVHAVYHTSLNHLRVSFWESGSIVHPVENYSVASTQPILLMISSKNSTSLEVTVADPTHEVESTTIEIGLHLTCQKCSYDSTKKSTTVAIVLPDGDHAGSSFSLVATKLSA